MTKTYLNILTKEELENGPVLQNEKDRFVLESDIAVFFHLEEMFNEHVKRTDKMVVGGDCILSKHDINLLVELIESEERKLESMFLDRWEFQIRPKVVFRNREEARERTDFNPTRAYLAEKSMLDSKYEIRKGELDGYEFEIEKHWFEISKKQILNYLTKLKFMLENAIEHNQIILSTYY